MAPVGKQIIKLFRSVFQFLHLSLHDLLEPGTVHVDVVFQIHRFTSERVPLCAISPNLMTAVLPDKILQE